MSQEPGKGVFVTSIQVILLLVGMVAVGARGQQITPSPYWKNRIDFPYDSFCARGTSKESIKWVKFTILLDPYDPNVVYFQDSRKYVFHYSFATALLDPFIGMSPQQFNAVTLFEQGQQAILGTVILPPAETWPSEARFPEYGIQFVRQDPYTPEQIRDLFHLVRAQVAAPPDVEAFYFPTYEQQAVAAAHRDWFESQDVPLSSTARWAEGNACYSEGWALGEVTFVPADGIDEAYHSGLLQPNDILLTDGIPAEVPFVAGILSLAPSTPNSHVAILARTYGVPFVYLAVADDAALAQALVGHRAIFSAYDDPYGGCDTRLIDTEGLLDDATVEQVLKLKEPAPLAISPMAELGAIDVSVEGLLPPDIEYVGGKAANFGMLRLAVPENAPEAIALSFDLWNAFLDQPLVPTTSLRLEPGQYMLFWADNDAEQGPTHTGFALSRNGESIGLFDVDGRTLIDSVSFERQATDVSFGRSVDAGDLWQSFTTPTPGQPNSNAPAQTSRGLVINEFMAANSATIEDPCEAGEYPDWIELYNASDDVITLDSMFLTDDINDPTKWQIRPAVAAATLREEIARRLSAYDAYPPSDMQMLSRDLAGIRSVFRNADVTGFSDELRDAVVAALTDPAYGFDPDAMLRFRSSTNVEDSADFVGAGLYDSFSGCLADALDDDDRGRCLCDPNRDDEHGVFDAIRKVFASFYNDNAYLERLRHAVNEADVGMALLVHHSFPDEIELANGVATFERRGPDENSTIAFVSQQGAISVTNPEDGSIPEEVTVTVLPSGTVVPPKLQQASSRLPLGGTVMDWRGDYMDLSNLLVAVSDVFGEVTGQVAYMLDLEYKKVAPGGAVLPAGGLVVKQVRQVPTPDQTPSVTPFLVNIPIELEVYPGEFELFDRTDVFADHRLKSRWQLETYSMALDANNLGWRLYAHMDIEYAADGRVQTVSGPMSLLPFADHRFEVDVTADDWRLADLGNPRTYHLQTTGIATAVAPAENPLLTPAELGTVAFNLPFKCLTLDVDYDHPVPSWHQQLWPSDAPSGLRSTTRDKVYLWSCPPPSDDDMLQERSFAADGISIRVSFYYPPPPANFADWAAHTAPLKRWRDTVIEGLTAQPIVLAGYYSRTYRPEHHNLIEHFLFEPAMEPGLSPDILDQLDSLNARFIHLIIDNREDGDQSQIMLCDATGAPATAAGP